MYNVANLINPQRIGKVIRNEDSGTDCIITRVAQHLHKCSNLHYSTEAKYLFCISPIPMGIETLSSTPFDKILAMPDRYSPRTRRKLEINFLLPSPHFVVTRPVQAPST